MNKLFYYESEGEFILTTVGIIATVLLVILFLSLSLFLYQKAAKKQGASKSVTKPLLYSAMAMALGIITSEFIPTLSLPAGGSITLFSMLFITLIGYWFGLGSGLTAALAYGLLQFVLDPKFISFPQVLLDYVLAFGALGLSGIFYQRKKGLILGYLTGVAGRFFFAWLAGVVIWGDSSLPFAGQAIYSLTYQLMYLLPETILTILLLLLPPVKKAMAKVKEMACS